MDAERVVPRPIKKTVRTSRKAAEALRLEIQQLARRLEIPAAVRVRRIPDAVPARAVPPRSGTRRGR
jgi:plasmid stabilization system protein ParE